MPASAPISPADWPPLAELQLGEFLRWLLRQRRRFRVVDRSMQPELCPGEEVLLDPSAYRDRPPLPGDIVVARHPHQADLLIVKRVAVVHPDSTCILLGDHQAVSEDSRNYGAVPLDLLLGRVCCRFG